MRERNAKRAWKDRRKGQSLESCHGASSPVDVYALEIENGVVIVEMDERPMNLILQFALEVIIVRERNAADRAVRLQTEPPLTAPYTLLRGDYLSAIRYYLKYITILHILYFTLLYFTYGGLAVGAQGGPKGLAGVAYLLYQGASHYSRRHAAFYDP